MITNNALRGIMAKKVNYRAEISTLMDRFATELEICCRNLVRETIRDVANGKPLPGFAESYQSSKIGKRR